MPRGAVSPGGRAIGRGPHDCMYRFVINFDAARDVETHTHRIGRTGRAGAKDGVAWTLVTLAEARQAADVVRS